MAAFHDTDGRIRSCRLASARKGEPDTNGRYISHSFIAGGRLVLSDLLTAQRVLNEKSEQDKHVTS